jgi:hypothetical protein
MIFNYTNILSKITFNVLSDMLNPFYSNLTKEINQDILNEANELSKQFALDYKEKYGYEIVSRPVKKMERILVKQQRNNSDIHFKVNSDFSAFRINTEVNDIVNKLDDLQKYFSDMDGLYFLRNPIIKEEQHFYLLRNSDDSTSKYKDIVVYSFGYHPKYKYIMEFQVGHPFASYVFTRDSYLRDNKDSDLVDLWDNNFYGKVKDKLLGTNTQVNLLNELNQLYDGRPIEQELYKIIEKIENNN